MALDDTIASVVRSRRMAITRASRRRRALAAPFVATLAAAPACGGGDDKGYDANPPMPRPTEPGHWEDQGGGVWHFVFDDGRIARKGAGQTTCLVYPRTECIDQEDVPDCYSNFVECPLGDAHSPSPWSTPPTPPTELPPADE